MSDSATMDKKRRLNTSQSSDNSGDDGKKRGRPRVDKQDESAADRRRTQIRKAQRAYRQRKESTLDELRKRVAELSNAMELMNKAFLECADQLARSGLSADQASHIRRVEMQYDELLKYVRNPEEERTPEVVSPVHRASINSHQRVETSNDLEPKNVPSWMDEAVLESTVNNYAPHEIGMGYTMYLDNAPSSVQTPTSISFPRRNSPRSNNIHTTFEVDMQIPATLPPPRTYSFQETTFARRLHRAVLESGYQLALDPSQRPESFNRAFRLCLITHDRNSLTAMMKNLLDRGPDDSLDSRMPMLHIGGAGTHFQRRNKFGVLQPKRQTENLGIIGPQALAFLERSIRENMTTDLTVEIAGFEGEWFDPYDVEGYLAEKGIFIDPLSSFAEANIDLITSSPTDSSPTSYSGLELQTSMSTTPDDPSAPTLQEQSERFGSSSTNAGEWVDYSFMQKMTDVGFSDASTGSWWNFLLPGEGMKQRLPHTTQWDGTGSSPYMSEDLNSVFARSAGPTLQQAKRTLIIDVAKFLKVLTTSASCLGKSPGFRRKDVDRALALSAFDPY